MRSPARVAAVLRARFAVLDPVVERGVPAVLLAGGDLDRAGGDARAAGVRIERGEVDRHPIDGGQAPQTTAAGQRYCDGPTRDAGTRRVRRAEQLHGRGSGQRRAVDRSVVITDGDRLRRHLPQPARRAGGSQNPGRALEIQGVQPRRVGIESHDGVVPSHAPFGGVDLHAPGEPHVAVQASDPGPARRDSRLRCPTLASRVQRDNGLGIQMQEALAQLVARRLAGQPHPPLRELGRLRHGDPPGGVGVRRLRCAAGETVAGLDADVAREAPLPRFLEAECLVAVHPEAGPIVSRGDRHRDADEPDGFILVGELLVGFDDRSVGQRDAAAPRLDDRGGIGAVDRHGSRRAAALHAEEDGDGERHHEREESDARGTLPPAHVAGARPA